jgi:DNA-binding NtrC family response regulator
MKRIVILDDNPEVRLALTAGLRHEFVIFPCSTARQAFQCLEQEIIEGMIVDIDLGPEITGIEFAEIVRKQNKTIKICLISAYTDSGDIQSAADRIDAIFFNKPVDEQRLIESIRGSRSDQR